MIKLLTDCPDRRRGLLWAREVYFETSNGYPFNANGFRLFKPRQPFGTYHSLMLSYDSEDKLGIRIRYSEPQPLPTFDVSEVINNMMSTIVEEYLM